MRRGSIAILLLVLGFGSPKPTRQVSPPDIRHQVESTLSTLGDLMVAGDDGADRYLEAFNLRKAGKQ